jgi:polyhydroxyalkanoate synthase
VAEKSEADEESAVEEESEAEEKSTAEEESETAERNRGAETPIEVGAIHGLGATYASRLEDAGIGSLEALTERRPAEVAEAAEVREQRARTWIDRAKTLLEEEETAT